MAYYTVGGGQILSRPVQNPPRMSSPSSFSQSYNAGVYISDVPLCFAGQCGNNGPVYGMAQARAFHGQTIHVAPVTNPQPPIVINIVCDQPAPRPWV